MKIRLDRKKIFEFIKTIFLTWYLLCLFKFINYGFRVNLSKLFWVSFAFFAIYIVWELIKNFQYYFEKFSKFLQETRRYYYSKYEILKNKKILNWFSNRFGFKQFFLLWILLITVFILWDYLIKYAFKNNYLLALYLFGVFVDIVFIKQLVDIVFLLLICVWIAIVRLFKFSGNVSFLCSFILIVLCCVFIILKETVYINKTSVWIFLFLTIGVFQEIFLSLLRKKI